MTSSPDQCLRAIQSAKRFAHSGEVALGWYALRDIDATKRAGLSDLAWSGHKHGATHGELLWLIEEIERHLSIEESAITKPNATT